MPNMPEKDPGLWAAMIAWLLLHQPQLYAAGLSIGIAVLRVMYGGGTSRQMYLEGALCGLVTLSLVPLLEWMGLPQSMATFRRRCWLPRRRESPRLLRPRCHQAS